MTKKQNTIIIRLIKIKLYFFNFSLKKFVKISTPICTPLIKAIDAPRKIIQIKKKIASSPAHGRAESSKYLNITCEKVITIIIKYKVAIMGLNTKLTRSLFIFPSSSVREEIKNFFIVFIFKIIYIKYILSIHKL